MQVDLTSIVETHVERFVVLRRESIEKIKLPALLRRKNPYLFMARHTDTPSDLAEELVAAALSSSEETMFGDTLEAIAIDMCAAVFGGQKSAATGIDLEFTRDGRRYVVAIKSGPNWGNSSQQAKMRQDFATAIRIIRQHDHTVDVRCVNGCCYGRGVKETGTFTKISGAPFWELISGSATMYQDLIQPLRRASSNGFVSERNRLTRRLAAELLNEWTLENGYIDWQKIVDYCSVA